LSVGVLSAPSPNPRISQVRRNLQPANSCDLAITMKPSNSASSTGTAVYSVNVQKNIDVRP
jgi:hypothetical protein